MFQRSIEEFYRGLRNMRRAPRKERRRDKDAGAIPQVLPNLHFGRGHVPDFPGSSQAYWDTDDEDNYVLADGQAMVELKGSWVLPKNSDCSPLQRQIKSFKITPRGMILSSGQLLHLYARKNHENGRH
eukprot:jgi/Bigna1/146821/aug1.121_g21529